MSHSKSMSPQMRQALQSLAGENGFIELPQFIETALYHPQIGYYAANRQRVGRHPRADFYTATSLRDAFAPIVAEAAARLLRDAGLDPRQTDWVEIGAEPDAGLLRDDDHPFRSLRCIRLGEPIQLAGQIALFSNELFDAQTFRQLRFRHGAWTEYGLAFNNGELAWTPRSSPHPDTLPWLAKLPAATAEGYTVDLPTGALALAERIASQPWHGAFIAFDYGKTWPSLAEDTPQGSARSYRQHRMAADILQQPGEQDITHHICWCDLQSALAARRFSRLSLQSQEAFIAHRAPDFLQNAFDPRRSPLDPLRAKLKELMHPALMGQKFQALSAIRHPEEKLISDLPSPHSNPFLANS